MIRKRFRNAIFSEDSSEFEDDVEDADYEEEDELDDEEDCSDEDYVEGAPRRRQGQPWASKKHKVLWGVGRFKKWLRTTNTHCPFDRISADELADVLSRFYAQYTPEKPTVLAPINFRIYRGNIQKFISSTTHGRDINIKTDPAFKRANEVFEARYLYLCKHYTIPRPPPIELEDHMKLETYFSTWRSRPRVLVDACWYFLTCAFGRRTREELINMTRDTFQLCTDGDGLDYVAMPVDKRHPVIPQYMYGPGVEIFKLYVKKLNPGEACFWQDPARGSSSNIPWYCQAQKQEKISNTMTRISISARLSKVYSAASLHTGCICDTSCYKVCRLQAALASASPEREPTQIDNDGPNFKMNWKEDIDGEQDSSLEQKQILLMKPEITESLSIQPMSPIKQEAEETEERFTVSTPVTSTSNRTVGTRPGACASTTVSNTYTSSYKSNSTLPIQNPYQSTTNMHKTLSPQEYNAGKAMVMDKIKSALLPQPKSPVYIKPSVKRASCGVEMSDGSTIPCKRKCYNHPPLSQGSTCGQKNRQCLRCTNQAVRNQSFSPPIPIGYLQVGQGDVNHFNACTVNGMSPSNVSPKVNYVPTGIGAVNGSSATTTKRCGDITVDSTSEGTVNMPSHLGPGSVINVDIPQKKMHQTIIVNGSLNNCVINFNM